MNFHKYMKKHNDVNYDKRKYFGGGKGVGYSVIVLSNK